MMWPKIRLLVSESSGILGFSEHLWYSVVTIFFVLVVVVIFIVAILQRIFLHGRYTLYTTRR